MQLSAPDDRRYAVNNTATGTYNHCPPLQMSVSVLAAICLLGSASDRNHTSTAETRTENRAPVFSFLSLMSLNNQEIAQGIIPRP